MVPAVSGGCGGRGVSGDPPAGWLLSSAGQAMSRYRTTAAECSRWWEQTAPADPSNASSEKIGSAVAAPRSRTGVR
jgi:hypothetical protein